MPAAITTEPSAEPYLPVEEVARRLDLPLGILLRRVEAGDVPSRREETPDGVRYSVRLGDLGIESPLVDPVAMAAPPPPPPVEVTNHARPAPVDENGSVDVVGTAQASSWPDKVVPPPAEELAEEAQTTHGRNGSIVEIELSSEPHRDVASMTSLDPRELVAGLLDRWERTLEQRIYSEQRQRFEAELNARQNLVKQLQLELQTARAEHAAAQAEKDRRIADRDRRISELEVRLPEPQDPAGKRRRWFFSR